MTTPEAVATTGRPPVAAPTPAKTADAGTSYLILKKKGDHWESVNHATARTTEAAIKAVVEKLAETDQAGTYVAVVASRWTPIEIVPKVERSLVLKAVK